MTNISNHSRSTRISVRPYKEYTPKIAESCFVDPSATVIGDVVLDNDCSVWPSAVIRGDMHKIRIGQNTNVQDNAVLHITHASRFNLDGWPLLIGEEVTIGHAAVLHGCTLGNRILVGIGAIILDGAIIEDEVMVGAGTLVPPGKTLTSGYLYVGSPCKQARTLKDEEKEFFSYSAKNYVDLKNDYLLS